MAADAAEEVSDISADNSPAKSEAVKKGKHKARNLKLRSGFRLDDDRFGF